MEKNKILELLNSQNDEDIILGLNILSTSEHLEEIFPRIYKNEGYRYFTSNINIKRKHIDDFTVVTNKEIFWIKDNQIGRARYEMSSHFKNDHNIVYNDNSITF